MMNARRSTIHRTHQHRRQRGLTLVELMVAMVISLIIMAGVGTLYVSTKRNYLVESGFSQLQENARYATNYMSMVTRNAGYVGCSSGALATSADSMTNTLNTTTGSSLYGFRTGLEGYEFTGTGPGQTYPSTQPTSLPAPDTNASDWAGPPATSGGSLSPLPTDLINTGLLLPGSDVLIVRSADDTHVEVAQNNSGDQVFVNNTGAKAGGCTGGATMYSGICPGDVLVISDCTKSVAFQATNVQATGGCPQAANCVNIAHSNAGSFTPGNSQGNWGGANPNAPANMTFGPGSKVMTISTKAFFVGLDKTTGLPALYVRDGSAAPQALVEGVENMQVLYGLDTTGDGIADEYVTAANVPFNAYGTSAAANPVTPGFDNVVSVRVSLLLETPQTLNGFRNDTKTYALGGVWTNALKSAVHIYPVKDQRLRKVVTFTIKLRNRSLSL